MVMINDQVNALESRENLATQISDLCKQELPRGLSWEGSQRFQITMSLDHLNPQGAVFKREELNACYARVLLDGATEMVYPVQYVWEDVLFQSERDETRKTVEWKFARGSSFQSFLLSPGVVEQVPHAPTPTGGNGKEHSPFGIQLDYASLPRTPSVNLLQIISWDVITFDMLASQLRWMNELDHIGVTAEVAGMSNALAYFNFPQYSPTSFFKNGRVFATSLGYGIWKECPCVVYEYRCEGSEFDVHADPDVAALAQKGSSFYSGKLLVDVTSGHLLCGDMTETIIATLERGEAKSLPVQKRRQVRVERLGQGESPEIASERVTPARAQAKPTLMDIERVLAEALRLSRCLQEFVARNEKEFNDLSMALRSIAQMGFQSTTGQNIDHWKRFSADLTSLLEQLAQQVTSTRIASFQERYPDLKNLLTRFVAYTDLAVTGSRRFYKDPVILQEVDEIMRQGRVDLSALNETLDVLDLALKDQVKCMSQQGSDSATDTRSFEMVQASSTPEALTNSVEKKTMIEVDRLSKKFRDVKAVDGVSFAVKQGEIFGFLGPNGAGKTTTIRMLIGLAHPTEGRATIGGFDCVTQKEAVHRITGVVFEVPTLYNRLSVKDNLLLFANLYQLPRGRVDEVMTRLALADVQGKRAEQLSKGWRQRVLIARALLHKPQVLFLDEPTSGLDPNSARMLHDLIKELRRDGVTIVLCTHDMYEADELCDRIGFIYKGKLVALDTPQALKAEGLRKELVIEFRDDGKLITQRYPFDAPEAVELIQRMQRAGQLVAVNTNQLTLANVFTRLTGGELS